MLSGVGWRVAQSGDANAAWQSPFDGGLHKSGCKEGERYGHVDLTCAAPLALCDTFDVGFCIVDKLTVITSAAVGMLNRPAAAAAASSSIHSMSTSSCVAIKPPRAQQPFLRVAAKQSLTWRYAANGSLRAASNPQRTRRRRPCELVLFEFRAVALPALFARLSLGTARLYGKRGRRPSPHRDSGM
jgi:hypothetical protein